MNDLEAGIQKLERSRGRHRLSIILVGVLLALTTTLGVSLSIVLTGGLVLWTDAELKTHHLRIVDRNGTTTVEIGTAVDGSGGLIKTLDSGGKVVAIIGPLTDSDGGAISLWDGNGNQVVAIRGVPDRGAITLWDGKGNQLVGIFGVESQGLVGLYNCESGQPASQPALQLMATDHGGLVGAQNTAGETVAMLGADSSGKGFVAATQPAVKLPAEVKEPK